MRSVSKNLEKGVIFIEKLISIPTAARMLGVSQNTLSRWIQQGKLPAVQFVAGAQLKIPTHIIENLLAKVMNK